jgi:nucleoside-diphosphate-sugar epimerase
MEHLRPSLPCPLSVKDRRISARTNGLEARQLLHGEDVARALVLLMRYFSVADAQTDISTGDWVTLRHLADALSTRARALTGHACPATFPDVDADVRARISPWTGAALYTKLGWRAGVALDDGLDDIVRTLAAGGPEALSRLDINDVL